MDRVERDLSGRARVVRLNVASVEGRQLAGRYGVRAVPTLLVFDGEGQTALRQVGRVQREAILDTVAAIEGR